MKNIHDAAYRRFLVKLQEARSRAGLSQEQLATGMKKHQTFVSKVETAQRNLDLLDFLIWAREVGADPVELLQELIREVQERKPKRLRVRLP